MSGGPFRLIHGGRSEEPTPGLLIVGAAEVVTLAGGVRAGERQGDVGRLSAADVGGPDAPDAPVVACWEGRIAAVGPRAALEAALEAEGYPLGRFARLDAGGGAVTPGLVDPHTHLLFAGSREGEWVLRQRGAGYLEILEAGGGILSTVAATRAASVDDLLAHGRRWLDEMLGHGVTTIEAKSGYGLDLETGDPADRGRPSARAGGSDRHRPDVPRRARRPARVPGAAGRDRGVRPVGHRGAAARRGRPRPGPVLRRLLRGRRVQRGPVAADPRGGGRLRDAAPAARRRARAVGRRGARGGARGVFGGPPRDAVRRRDRRAGGRGSRGGGHADGVRPVVATVLPATTWFLMKDHGAPARTFIDSGIPVAIGTDFNPGTSPTASLPLAMTVACLELGLTPDEALAAVTINAAWAVGLEDEVGSLEPGKSADLVIWRVPTSTQIPYWPAADLARTVVKRGRVVLDRG